MEREKPGQRRPIYSKASPNSLNQHAPYIGNSRKNISNHSGSPERHLSPRKNITHKSGYYYKQEQDYTNISSMHKNIRTIVNTTPDMEIKTDKKQRSTISVHSTQKSAIIYISPQVRYRIKSHINMPNIMYS